MDIFQHGSVNYNSRGGYKPEVIVIHCTDGVFPGDLKWLQKRGSWVSAHFFISPDGTIFQLVHTKNAAWHAGRVVRPTASLKSRYGIYINPNRYTIGIEVSMLAKNQAKEKQMKSLKWLVKDLSKKHNIRIDREHIWGHREIRADKTCPGTISVDKLVYDINNPKNEKIILTKGGVEVWSYVCGVNPSTT